MSFIDLFLEKDNYWEKKAMEIATRSINNSNKLSEYKAVIEIMYEALVSDDPVFRAAARTTYEKIILEKK